MALPGFKDVETIAADLTEAPAEPFDAVLFDVRRARRPAPPRRHLDVMRLKSPNDVSALDVQAAFLERAPLRSPLVYCTCSLEPEEGEVQVNAFLAVHPSSRVPVDPAEIGGLAACVTKDGDLCTLPHPFLVPEANADLAGLAARLVRTAQ